MPLEGLLQELRQVFALPNQAQSARRKLRNICHITSVDTYISLFRESLYQWNNVSAAEAQERFVENLKPETHLYVEERQPLNLDHAVRFAQSFDQTRYGDNRGFGRGRNGGRNGQRGRHNNGGQNGARYPAADGSGQAGNGNRSWSRGNCSRTSNRSRNGYRGCNKGTVTCYQYSHQGHVAPDCMAPTPQGRSHSPEKN